MPTYSAQSGDILTGITAQFGVTLAVLGGCQPLDLEPEHDLSGADADCFRRLHAVIRHGHKRSR